METYRNVCLFVLLFFSISAFAAPSDSLTADIEVKYSDAKITFSANLPILKGIPGARKAFYTYMWDFGDGHFSTDASPSHQYAKPGEYEVELYFVSNYDNGPKPKRPRRKVKVEPSHTSLNPVPSSAEQRFFNPGQLFRLGKNTDALPGEDLVVIAGLQNSEKGQLFLLFNEKVFPANGFIQKGYSFYNGAVVNDSKETTAHRELWASCPGVTMTHSGSPDYGAPKELNFSGKTAVKYFESLFKNYRSVSTFTVNGNGADQFSFFQFDVSKELMSDTDAVVTVTGVFIPEKGRARVHKIDIPIVTSHDPNRMSLKETNLSYRKSSKRDALTYKIQFENDGNGDAKEIRVGIKLPSALDISTIKILNSYPDCKPCSVTQKDNCFYFAKQGEDSVVFEFRGISLPGFGALDIADRDSARGFVRFEVRPKKKLPNESFQGQAKITFDKNKPITTNAPTGRFRKSWSPVIIAGYHFFINDIQESKGPIEKIRPGILIGVGVTPLAPYRKLYWQPEFYITTFNGQQKQDNIIENGPLDVPGMGVFYYEHYDRKVEAQAIQFRLTPVNIRYNILPWLSAGIGASLEKTVYTRYRDDRTYYVIINSMENGVSVSHPAPGGLSDKVRVNPMVDLSIGKAYLGPSIGFRYLYGSKNGQSGQMYVAWRL